MKTLEEICGYKEPAHLIARIKELENELNDTKEKLKITENLLMFERRESNGFLETDGR